MSSEDPTWVAIQEGFRRLGDALRDLKNKLAADFRLLVDLSEDIKELITAMKFNARPRAWERSYPRPIMSQVVERNPRRFLRRSQNR